MAEKFSTSWADIRTYTDWLLLAAGLLLFCLGLAAIYSASASFAKGGAALSGFVIKQAAWGAIGSLIYIAAVKADYRNFMKYAAPLFACMVLTLIVLLLSGHSARGAQRWFNFGFFRFQPSEFGKVVFALALAKLCAALPPNSPRRICAACAVAGAAILPIMLQPDLGSSLVYAVMLLAVFVAAGMPVKFLASIVGAGLAALPLLWFIMKPYQRMRVMVFIDPTVDPQGAGYNVIQSRIAVGSGGLFGKGFMHGTQGKLHFLPEPHTDFIFSVFSEEFGFLGCSVVLLLFALLLWRVLNIAQYTKDMRGKLFCAAVAAWLWFQIAESVAMSMGLAPVTGIPLPLFSYGGSSILVISLALGLVQSVNVAARQDRF
ncbi:rod shape-determining protein RodA [Synergistes jonesii]|uniref:Peptidoglycan glycosyltransferase RodA n=1 Tax=Synergistes jonesii TaxID=2754 RepID=A0A073IRQ9_9BACT|nr:rod shape-determining protein RodA [Synergistes jonesii]KEJ92464.1 rod shape-determining protein RodA [Synergistes jonesii]OFB61637.1 rod shape-determining protein RodA [Synergistes jonesii]OFB63130.1 rod shape-determining protein RodA [Synergistes jonesii]OFB64001.1 rod shape-determining protein RodA [Synergistes jonesii]OFB67836.1 rod shape-determining protein RodA [Synergistes jonesii]